MLEGQTRFMVLLQTYSLKSHELLYVPRFVASYHLSVEKKRTFLTPTLSQCSDSTCIRVAFRSEGMICLIGPLQADGLAGKRQISYRPVSLSGILLSVSHWMESIRRRQ